MTASISVPRINSNDDTVTLVGLKVAIGARVSIGMVVAEIETDKSVVEIEASEAGFVIGICGAPGDELTVGKPLLWLGATPEATVPHEDAGGSPTVMDSWDAATRPALSARARFRQRRASTNAATPAQTSGAATSAQANGATTPGHTNGLRGPARAADQGVSVPQAPGVLRALTAEQRAMAQTVNWHRDHAMAGYIETQYDVAAWADWADAFKAQHRLMLSPLLPLLAWRLARLAAQTPACNATLVDGQRYDYQVVNLGFTVQAGDALLLVCVRDAGDTAAPVFVSALGELMRRAIARKLAPHEMQGVTVGFSSMARWRMSRHMPVLAPHTALMMGHTVGRDGVGVLGATYDHRVLNGAQVAQLLALMNRPQ